MWGKDSTIADKKENPYTYSLSLTSTHHPFLVADANH